ncbi:putative spermidine/putrescine transport system permease protein [Caballeronia udeis]
MDMVNRLRRVFPSLPWLAPALIILLIVYLLPLAKVLTISVMEPVVGFGNYEKLLLDAGMRHIFWTTFRISGITTVVSVALGYVVALAMVNAPRRQFQLMLVCVLIPFWISVLVRAFAWIVLLRSGGVINSALLSLGIIKEPLDLLYNDFGVVVGMVHYMVPLAVLTIYGQMSGIDTRLAMAARGLGARPLYAFARIFLPLCVPGISAAAILIFITALGFYIVPAMLGGGKTLMLAEYVSLMINATVDWGMGTAMASTLAVLVLMLMFLLSRIVNLRRVFGGA